METRKHDRVAVYRPATIFVAPDAKGIGCFVVDISDGGAGLHVDSVAGIPATFELQIHSETGRRFCKVAWAQPRKIGVTFSTLDPSSVAEIPPAGNRKHPRRKVTDVGKIIINQPFSMIDCIVVDISEGGACIELLEPAQLPEAFELVFARKRRLCVVVWQNQNRMGVTFK
jgi:hypothetical protein